jgi:hypothetical protein
LIYCPTQPGDERRALEAAARYRALAVEDFRAALERARFYAYPNPPAAAAVSSGATLRLRRAAALYRIARAAAADAERRAWRELYDYHQATTAHQTTGDTAERR